MTQAAPEPAITTPAIRLAELMAALSIATDLGMGQPLEFALCSCVLAMRLGNSLRMSPGELRAVYYYSLLRYIGCNAETHAVTALIGDELMLRQDIASVDNGNDGQVINLIIRYLRQANAGAPPLQAMSAIAHGVIGARGFFNEQFRGHCEVAQRLAERLGFGPDIIQALGQLYERWDGKGMPHGLKGDQVSPAVLAVTLAQDVIIHQRLGGSEAAVAVVRQRRGGAYSPAMADRFCERAGDLLAGLDSEPSWDMVLSMEPGAQATLDDAQFDQACRALADFADVKSPYTLGHSHGVAALAEGAARAQRLSANEITALRRAALLHDIGRVGISTAIWTKAGALSAREWEQVRLHPYYTERVLSRPVVLAELGAVAALHHERLDGSGYYRAIKSAQLSPTARILAAADVYHAMTEPRPHRPAISADSAAVTLRAEASAGRLDADAVRGVLIAAGHTHAVSMRELPNGLTTRETDVLRLVARGQSNKEVARRLIISPKTVDNHLQHIYEKIGVSTRAAATLFAVEKHLIGDA